MTNVNRAMWAASGEADVCTVVDTARLSGASPFATILKTISEWIRTITGVGNYRATTSRPSGEMRAGRVLLPRSSWRLLCEALLPAPGPSLDTADSIGLN